MNLNTLKMLKCKTCGKEIIQKYSKLPIYCSRHCKNKDPELTLKSNKKRRETWEAGGGHPMTIPSFKEKHKETLQKKYGVSYASQNKEIRQKTYDTKTERYGNPNYCNPEKGKATKLKRYGTTQFNQEYCLKRRLLKAQWKHLTILSDILTCSLEEPVEVKCNTCGRVWSTSIDNNRIPSCAFCSQSCNSTSKGSIEVYEFLKQYIPESEIRTNDRSILKKNELDIYIPSKDLAIEYNGLYYHSDNFKDKEYHLRKTKACIVKGIQLIHLSEYHWLNKKELVKSMLLSRLGLTPKRIYARNCSVSIITSKEKKGFMEENHLQGDCRSSINIGLFYEGSLVSAMTLGKPRYTRLYSYEILRYANKQNTNVVGGFSKLLKFFENNFEFVSILSYADRDWSIGAVYRECGFMDIGTTPPNYFYTKGTLLYSREVFQKHKLKHLLENYDPLLTEYENMKNNGYSRIYNTGNLKFIYKADYKT